MKCWKLILVGFIFVFLLTVAQGIDFQGAGFIKADQAKLAALENQTTGLNISVSAVWTLDVGQDLLRLDWNTTAIGGSGSYIYQSLVNRSDISAVGEGYKSGNYISDGIGFKEPFPSPEVGLKVSIKDRQTNKTVSRRYVLAVPLVLYNADGSPMGLYNGTLDNGGLNESKIVSTMGAIG